MCSTDDEGSTRERIRDAAIRRFAADGLDASLRAIATDAGVSAPLILHYFGSRDGLREACDSHVVALARENKLAVLDPVRGAASLAEMSADVGWWAPIFGYLLRLLQAGGQAAAGIVDRLADSADEYLEHGVAAGTVRPSRDPSARARLLAEMSLGALLLQLPARRERFDLDEFPAWLNEYYRRIAPPVLELYTHGLLTDSTLLDAYLDTMGDTAPAPVTRPSTQEGLS